MSRKPFNPQRPHERRPHDRPHDRRQRAPAKLDPDLVRIYGFHAARAALASPRRRVVAVYATAAAAERLAPEIAQSGAPLTVASAQEIAARLRSDAVHQGVLVEARPLEPPSLDDLSDDSVIVALDQVTDPHNVGAIVRTAAAFGLDAVLTTERHAPAMAGALAKSASGGLEFVSILAVVNLARALDELGERGFLRVGLDSEAEAPLGSLALARPLVLMLGAEGKGLRRLTRERCDVLARLELPGPIKSLNVSNACAVALALAMPKLAPRT